MTQNTEKLKLNLVELTNFAAQGCYNAIVKADKNKVKQLLKDLKNHQPVRLGQLSMGDAVNIPVMITLDYSEFVGPGFNTEIFQLSTQAMLKNVGDKLQAKQDLNLMSDEDQSGVLVNVPGVIRSKDNYNVMVMAFALNNPEKITLKLMYVDPNQFEALRDKA